LAKQLNLRAGRIQALARHLKETEEALSERAVADVIAVRTEGHSKSEEARRLRKVTLPASALTGTGSETWTALWEAARQFSQESAYPGQTFPVVENGAHCVLCQQDFDHEARQRLKQFEAFVASTTERELRQLRETFTQRRKTFTDLRTTTEAVEESLKEIRIEHQALADAIAAALATNENRRKAIVLALTEDNNLAADCQDLVSVSGEANELAEQIASRIRTLRSSTTDQTRKRMAAEAQELRARKLLAKHEQTILDEIERRKKYAAYGLSVDETRTQAITQKSTAVTKTAVSQRLKQSFKHELAHLAFRHVEVELREAGGADGVLYHKLILTRAPGVE
jgi:hypothetical protein